MSHLGLTKHAFDLIRQEAEHDNVPKKCSFCGEIFVHGSSLTRHIRLKHSADFVPTDKKVSLYAKCPVCQQTFYKTRLACRTFFIGS